MCSAYCRVGRSLTLDELVTNEYKLDEINQGYADMYAGMNIWAPEAE